MVKEAEYSSLKISEEIRNRLEEEFPTIQALATASPSEVIRRCEINKNRLVPE